MAGETQEQGLMEMLGGWGGVGNLLLGSATGGIGNLLGTALGGGFSDLLGLGQDEVDPIDEAKNMLALKNASLVNTNAMGQRGASATLGAKTAMDSFQPTASSIYDRNQSNSLAAKMLDSSSQQNLLARQTADRNAGNMQSQMMDVARQSGSSPSAMMAIARQGGEAANQGMTQLLGQMGQNTQSALGASAGINQNASQIFNAARGQEYQQDVVPYMNQYHDMSGLALGGLQTGAQNRRDIQMQNQQTKDGLSIDPLGYFNKAMGNNLGAINTRNILGGGRQDILKGG